MTTIDSRQIKHYLLDEMENDERENFEERLFTDDDFFYEVAEAENALVDLYVRNELGVDERQRFKKSLERIPSRNQKVANAAVLRSLIGDENAQRELVNVTEPDGIWIRLSALFRSPGFGYSMGAFALIFAIASLLLLVENGRRNAEIAGLQSELANSNQQSMNESELERQLAESRVKESELQTQIDSEKGVSGDLTADLERERENRRRLEAEIAGLRKRRPDLPPSNRLSPGDPPTIAAITLKPFGSRGIGDAPRMNFKGGANRVSILLTLPENTDPNERLSVQLNGKTIARNVAANTSSGTLPTLAVTIAKTQLRPGANTITAHDRSGGKVAEYVLNVED